jgi:hypothetical protein
MNISVIHNVSFAASIHNELIDLGLHPLTAIAVLSAITNTTSFYYTTQTEASNIVLR